MQIAVIIPIYKTLPDASELAALHNITTVLGSYAIFFVAPPHLPLDAYHCPTIEPRRFDAVYFEGIAGYNKLMLSVEFYARFKSYTYVLICQLDAWVFHNDLSVWTRKKYDYVGAPWRHSDWSKKVYYFLSTSNYWVFRYLFKYLFLMHGKQLLVGNGGLSLRNTQKFIFLSRLFKSAIAKWPYHEDIFWSLLGVIFRPFFVSASSSDAMAFSFEEQPTKCFLANLNKLPFGCHAWEKNEPEFWSKYITFNTL